MKFNPELSLGDIIQIVATLLAAIGLFFTGFQLRTAAKERRAGYLSDFLRNFWGDKEITQAYYAFEYDEFIYDPAHFHKSELERRVDRMLESFGVLSKLYCAGLLSLEDISLLEYEFLVVFQNKEIQKYFAVLDDWFRTRLRGQTAFKEYREVAALLLSERTSYLRKR
jgi:hypothetical protein